MDLIIKNITFCGVYVHFLLTIVAFFYIAAFGVDAAFSYKYNQQLGICKDIGLAISSGFTTSHVIPVCFRGLLCSFYELEVVLG